MSIRYYKLFDILNRRGMKKSDLTKVISSATIAKLSKGQYISGEAIEKICRFLNCQPGDIMEILDTIDEIPEANSKLQRKSFVIENKNADSIEEQFIETIPNETTESFADEEGLTKRTFLQDNN